MACHIAAEVEKVGDMKVTDQAPAALPPAIAPPLQAAEAPAALPPAIASPPQAAEDQKIENPVAIEQVTVEPATKAPGAADEAATKPPEVEAGAQGAKISLLDCDIGHFNDTKAAIIAVAFVFGVTFLTYVVPYFACTSWHCWGASFTVRRGLCLCVPVTWLVCVMTYSRHRPKLCVIGTILFTLTTTHSLITGKPYSVAFYMGGLVLSLILFVTVPGACTSKHKVFGFLFPILGVVVQAALSTAVQRLNLVSSSLPPSLFFIKPVLLPVLKNVYAAVTFLFSQFLVLRFYQAPMSMASPLTYLATIVGSLESSSLGTCLTIPAMYQENKGELWFQLIFFLVSNALSELSSRRAVPQGLVKVLKAGGKTGWKFTPMEDALRRLKLQVSYIVWGWPLGMVVALIVSHAGDPGSSAMQWMGFWEVYAAAGLYFLQQVAVDLIYIKMMRLPGSTIRENWRLALEPGRAIPFLGTSSVDQIPPEASRAATPQEDTKILEFPIGCYRVPMPVMANLVVICMGGSIFAGTMTGILGTCATGLPRSLCAAE